MTNLDENVAPVFRRALVNGTSQDGALPEKQERFLSAYKQAENSDNSNTHTALFPL